MWNIRQEVPPAASLIPSGKKCAAFVDPMNKAAAEKKAAYANKLQDKFARQQFKTQQKGAKIGR
jgi:hypothetical protein